MSWIGERHAEQVTSIHDAVAAFTGPACSFWPYKLVVGLLARLVARHPPPRLNVQTRTTVTAITTTTGDKSEIWNIAATSRGDVRARRVVFATNAYKAGLLPQFKGSIVPIRGMASHIAPALISTFVTAGNKEAKKKGEVGVGVKPGVVRSTPAPQQHVQHLLWSGAGRRLSQPAAGWRHRCRRREVEV